MSQQPLLSAEDLAQERDIEVVEPPRSNSSQLSSLVSSAKGSTDSLGARAGKKASKLLNRASAVFSREEDNKREAARSSWIPTFQSFKDWWERKGLTFVFFSVYVVVNAILFAEAVHRYYELSKENDAINDGVIIARGFGALLNFNCALILIPVLRNALTKLRKTRLHKFIPWDYNIIFHKRVAWWIAICGTFHGVAHYVNYHIVGTPWALSWTTLAGITGHLISLVMLVMYAFAADAVKRNHFNAFYMTHHLFVAFFILLLLHGPVFWIWFLLPGILYIAERLLREYRGAQGTVVLRTRSHPSSVLEIHMRKPTFKYRAGQYLYLNCPYISRYEWHPFTISSSPFQDYVSCHIRCVGPWTKALEAIIGCDKQGMLLVIDKVKGPDGSPILRVDGPFGSASEDCLKYETVMLVGAGIGITPFASILRTITMCMADPSRQRNMKCLKVYFFWICRDYTAFEWFRDLMLETETEMRELNSNLFDFNIFLTGQLKSDQIRSLATDSVGHGMTADPITGLDAATNFGRPKWDTIFPLIREKHPDERVGVFFCGPPPLGHRLKDCSRDYSKGYSGRFVFHEENF
eukprot:TRINITY_DN5307_c0_g2_i1.p1 TRINITY_DN5307_c0_g2~~TRINITY_DN5307_c0_g2_i1.p1  ORF type:complete len:579 (+),score=114.55 TRINITY_DN5307_c0_g2_i1:193-1929(+)